jgi:hypothetical protein
VAASLSTIVLGGNVIAQRPQALRQSAQLMRNTVNSYRLLPRPEDLHEGVQRLVDARDAASMRSRASSGGVIAVVLLRLFLPGTDAMVGERTPAR